MQLISTRKKWLSRALFGVLLAAFGASAHAQLRIQITSGVERPIPIAIVPFGWEGPAQNAPFDLTAVITADLGNSGRFAPLPERDMVSRPTQPVQVNFQNWRALQTDVLLIGRLIENSPGRYTAVFQLFDVLRGEQLLGFRLTSSAEDLRATAHRIADMVFEELTGIPGVFSTRIAYVSEQRTGNARTFRLIVADADGENARVIAESSQPLMSPAWSPDGRRVAYVSFEGNQSAIYVQTLRTGTRERVSSRAGINGAPSFSPDGRQLALTLSLDGNLDIHTLDLGTQVLRRITESPAIDTEPTWSADGRTLFFTSDRAGGPQIYRAEAVPGARAERVTFEGTYNTRPRLSPDGERLAIVHRDRGNDRVAILDPSTGLLQVLSQGRLDESPSFAPNGAMIIYATRDGGRGVLAAVSSDGRVRQQIAAVAGEVREPVWSPFALP
jgi:TolB protein